MKQILVTGGAGYIGSHTVVELIEAGYQPIIVDNFSNSKPSVIARLEQITKQPITLEQVDLCDKSSLRHIFTKYDFSTIIHFAGFKAVGESVTKPLKYYQNNLISTLNLCELMTEHGINQFIFSSSATVYGDPAKVPITEDMPLRATNPYGRTKLMIEEILNDLSSATPGLSISMLRYFNPIGAHSSGLIGEDPNDIPNNLLPYVAQVAVGKLEKLRVFGDDYDTLDGTGVRDYIHVVDLAKGHVAALRHMPEPGACEAYNLGTGKGYSVIEVIEAFTKASGQKIEYEIVARRPGDIATCYANPTKAKDELDWQTSLSLDQACADAWRWQQFVSTQKGH